MKDLRSDSVTMRTETGKNSKGNWRSVRESSARGGGEGGVSQRQRERPYLVLFPLPRQKEHHIRKISLSDINNNVWGGGPTKVGNDDPENREGSPELCLCKQEVT